MQEKMAFPIRYVARQVGMTQYDIRHGKSDASHAVERCMNSIVNLDAAGLEEALFHAAVHLKRLEVITNVIVPVCSRMGELWKRGDLKIINEHLATPVYRARL